MKTMARIFLVIGVAGLLAITLNAQAGFPDGTRITMLQWNHFVPRYDEWFDGWVQAWGEANNVEVVVDHIDFAELSPSLAAEIEAGEGHTLVELISSPAAFIEGLHELNGVNVLAEERFGERVSTCQATSYLPMTDTYFAYTHGYVPDPGNYRISLWTAAGYPNGPQTYQDLLDGGRIILEQTGIPIGLGMSPELDSEMAANAIIWSFGGSIQDENENVVLNSPETIAAVEFLAQLQNEVMTDDVFNWTASSNNQGLIAGELSYILNSISAYRSLQKVDETAAADIGFTSALAGPAGAFASSHVWQIYVIPNYVEGDEWAAAQQFLLDHTAAYSEATYNSELYDFPCYPSTVPELSDWLAEDPFGSVPADKLAVLANVNEWSVYPGYPGTSNPAIGQVLGEYIISNMVAQVARGELTAEEAVAAAHERIEVIFAEWRAKGLVGGGE